MNTITEKWALFVFAIALPTRKTAIRIIGNIIVFSLFLLMLYIKKQNKLFVDHNSLLWPMAKPKKQNYFQIAKHLNGYGKEQQKSIRMEQLCFEKELAHGQWDRRELGNRDQLHREPLMMALPQKAFQDTGNVPVFPRAPKPEDNVSIHTISSLFCEHSQRRKRSNTNSGIRCRLEQYLATITQPHLYKRIGGQGGRIVSVIMDLKRFLFSLPWYGTFLSLLVLDFMFSLIHI